MTVEDSAILNFHGSFCAIVIYHFCIERDAGDRDVPPNSETPSEPTRGVVRLEVQDSGVARIMLDNPAKLNAISLSMWQDLAEALARWASDPAVRCVVLAGQGEKAFCVGADISQMDSMRSGPEASAEYDRITKSTLAQLQAFPKPTIAMVSGFCIGAGVALAAACDLRVAAAGSRFGIPSARLGIAYLYLCVKRLNELVGPAQAKRLLYTGEKYAAEEMLRIGLIDELVPAGDVVQRVCALATGIAANAPLSLAAAKFSVDTACGDAAESDIAACASRERACAESDDHAEGRRAFMEKRAPVFRGR